MINNLKRVKRVCVFFFFMVVGSVTQCVSMHRSTSAFCWSPVDLARALGFERKINLRTRRPIDQRSPRILDRKSNSIRRVSKV